ncbi:MAG: RNA polymerase sigma factor [Acidimicrobiales bacterium]
MSTTLDRAWRDERARIVASLARRFADLTLAEDATQEAFAAAATAWPRTGTPDRPGAWLMTTAYRKAIGIRRKQRPTESLDEAFADVEAPTAYAGDVPGVGGGNPAAIDDDLFVLMTTCCHPALHTDARIALTLRHVCGLTVAEIAAGFVVAEATMAKRLVRARRKILDAGIAFTPPSAEDLPGRVDDVRTVVYLVFTEGHLSAGTGSAVRVDLCEEAVWLARLLHGLDPGDAESCGLLALLLIQHSRRAARFDALGRLVPLLEQQRESWDRSAIDEARGLLAGAHHGHPGPRQVEAAIALLHVAGDAPNWARIADLYGVLARLAPSPVVEVNRSLAVGRADGPQAGLAVLAPVLADPHMARYAPLFAVQADLLESSGDVAGARSAWERAAELATNPEQVSALRLRHNRLPHDSTGS